MCFNVKFGPMLKLSPQFISIQNGLGRPRQMSLTNKTSVKVIPCPLRLQIPDHGWMPS